MFYSRYEYDEGLEPQYRAALFSSFTKTIAKPKLHPLVVVDAVHALKVPPVPPLPPYPFVP
jgi:hypothetical protein